MRKDKIKFSIFCLVIFCLVSLPVTQITLLGYVPDTSSIYSFYTTDNVSQITNAQVVKNGGSSIVSCASNYATMVRKSLDNVLGESVQINNPSASILKQIDSYIKDNVLYAEMVGGTEVVYGYNPSLLRYVMVDNQKVNLQIAKNKDYIVIGYPLILGSF